MTPNHVLNDDPRTMHVYEYNCIRYMSGRGGGGGGDTIKISCPPDTLLSSYAMNCASSQTLQRISCDVQTNTNLYFHIFAHFSKTNHLSIFTLEGFSFFVINISVVKFLLSPSIYGRLPKLEKG